MGVDEIDHLGKRHKIRGAKGPGRTLGSSFIWVCVGEDNLAKETENGVERRDKMQKLWPSESQGERGLLY